MHKMSLAFVRNCKMAALALILASKQRQATATATTAA